MHKQYLHLYVATYEAMVNAKCVTPQLIQRMSVDGYMVELADGPLAGLLAGRDSVAALGIDGTQQGPLSLVGSTRAIRAALASCHDF